MTVRIYFTALLLLGIFAAAESLKGRGMPTQMAPLQLTLEQMPRTFESWTGEDVSLDPQVFRASREMAINRHYHNKDDVVELHSDVFTTMFMRIGVRTPHQPEECYANNGFIVESSQTVQIPTPSNRSQPARLLALSRDGSRVYCLYWYQVADATFWNSDEQRRVVQSFRGRPTWPPLIKVMLQTSADSPAAAERKLKSLAGMVYAWTRANTIEALHLISHAVGSDGCRVRTSKSGTSSPFQMHNSETPSLDSRNSNGSSRTKVLFLNRSYWPDAEATGQLLTELCENLAPGFDVTVVAGQPNDNPTAAEYRRWGTEVRHGVRIRRVLHTQFAKRSLVGRIINYLSFLWGAFWTAAFAERPDLVVVETDPPLLCLIGWYLKRVRSAKLIVYLQDIHPDIGIALGRLTDGWLTRMLRRLMLRSYRAADRVLVLSRDMRQRMIDWGVPAERIECVSNWVDTRQVRPIKSDNAFRKQHQLQSQFVVMYSGNLGLCQRLEDVVTAASHLRDRQDILFLIVGEGALKTQLKEQVRELDLHNVRFLPYQPKAQLAESLSAADLHLVPLDPRVASCLMPSKLYGALASGTPIAVVAPDDCDLAELTREHKVGFVTPPGQPEKLAQAIASMAELSEDRRQQMGARARRLAETQYDRRAGTSQFQAVLVEELGFQAPRDPDVSVGRAAAGGKPVPVTAD